MDIERLSPAEARVHLQLTEALRDALSARDPLAAVTNLCEAWEAPHEERKQRVRELKQAIRRAEAHFQWSEVEKLEAELAELEM